MVWPVIMTAAASTAAERIQPITRALVASSSLVRGSQPPAVHRPCPHILHKHGGAPNQLAKELLSILLVEVDADVIIVVLFHQETEGEIFPLVPVRRDVAHRIAGGRELHLDNFRGEFPR